MFALSERDKGRRILGVGDGPSSFNTEATASGWQVISVDPAYQLTAAQMETRLETSVEQMVNAVSLNPRHWIWSHFKSASDLLEHRRTVHRGFCADFAAASPGTRYIAAALPRLPFASGSFDLALCSHLLFSWSGVLDLSFHRESISEMLRVASEVRIFPTVRSLGVRRSRYVDVLRDELEARGFAIHIEPMKRAGGDHEGAEQLVISAPARRSAGEDGPRSSGLTQRETQCQTPH
jgi:hypothetical protein